MCSEERPVFGDLSDKLLFESAERAAVREQGLNVLRELVAESLQGSSDHADEGQWQLWALGSYVVGTCSPTSDQDLVLATCSSLPMDLEEVKDAVAKGLLELPGVHDLVRVETALVPLLTFVYEIDGVSIPFDLGFARLPFKTLPSAAQDIKEHLLLSLDPRTVASINGVRVAHELLKLVPDIKTFRIALAVVKYWAKQRGLYSNKLGFLGGVSWSILVAKAAVLYPKDSPEELVLHFFKMFATWSWNVPVRVVGLGDTSDWNVGCAIVTPTRPYFNTARNMTATALEAITAELKRALVLAEGVPVGKIHWGPVMAPFDVTCCREYIRVEAASSLLCDHAWHSAWAGYVEAQLRSLTLGVEANMTGVSLRPMPNVEDDEPNVTVFIIGVMPRPRMREQCRMRLGQIVDQFARSLSMAATPDCSVSFSLVGAREVWPERLSRAPLTDRTNKLSEPATTSKEPVIDGREALKAALKEAVADRLRESESEQTLCGTPGSGRKRWLDEDQAKFRGQRRRDVPLPGGRTPTPETDEESRELVFTS
eukprot:CAMPEP_0114556702 /NCGR_PEP_ID=MMETSP0114-20121206/9429_1 /TAXON_ID=31324 /ORGANISM="Goniomonas sp, Strain m" /LENGTH=539 /DNA_ID=CAMNT_0001741923 /DNA_START=41 /DNA_END=1660 /DNA_ORIENTATION=-